MRIRLVMILLLGFALGARAEKIDDAPLRRWIARQADVHTLSADFVQTRRLRVLRDPVARPGHFWFQAPGQFRWELGSPPETIALRLDAAIFLISVRKHTFSRQDPAALPGDRRVSALPALEFPLATDYSDFNRRFEVLKLTTADGICRVDLLPRDAGTRKYLQNIALVFHENDGTLQSFEIAFRDGSALRNEFSNVRLNEPIAPAIFRFDLTGYSENRAQD